MWTDDGRTTEASHSISSPGAFGSGELKKEGVGVGYQNGPISAYNQVPILFVRGIVEYVYFIVLYRTSCRKPYFLRYRQLEVGGVTMYDNG